MEKQLLAINDLYPLCLDQQRKINNELVHGGIRTLFQLVIGCLENADASLWSQKYAFDILKPFKVYVGQNFL